MKKTAILLIISVVIIAMTVIGYQHTFSTGKWIRFPNMREKMLSSMEKQVKIIGASREEIEESLGSPEVLESDTISFKVDRKEYPANQVMIYYIGSDYMDILWLVIVMDENGIAEKYFIDVS